MSPVARQTGVEACELDRVTVTNVSQTLAQLGVVLSPHIRVLSLQNVGTTNIYIAVDGVATAASFLLLPLGATTVRVTAAGRGASLQLVDPIGQGDLNVQQMGDEG